MDRGTTRFVPNGPSQKVSMDGSNLGRAEVSSASLCAAQGESKLAGLIYSIIYTSEWYCITLSCLFPEVYEQTFWMRAFGHPTPKRSVVYSNSALIGSLHTGKMTREDLKPEFGTTRRYVNREGKQRFPGNARLKSTQSSGNSICQSTCQHIGLTNVWHAVHESVETDRGSTPGNTWRNFFKLWGTQGWNSGQQCLDRVG